jgi:hypothetical protein
VDCRVVRVAALLLTPRNDVARVGVKRSVHAECREAAGLGAGSFTAFWMTGGESFIFD